MYLSILHNTHNSKSPDNAVPNWLIILWRWRVRPLFFIEPSIRLVRNGDIGYLDPPSNQA
jgi:hypothetical protein